MKTCATCKKEKTFSEYNKHSGMKDGLQYSCKDCCKEQRKMYKHKTKEYAAKYRKENAEICKDRIGKWKQNNKGSVNAQTAKRHAAKMLRTVTWSDKDRIKAYYDVCAFFNEVNGFIKYHVDHIIPMQGKIVSGLHVHNNLQVIPAKENMSKNNKWGSY